MSTRSSAKASGAGGGRWLAADPSKRWAEVFYLAYSPFWILWALCVLVPLALYEHLDEWGYLLVGLAAALPCAVVPLLVPGAADRGRPLAERFWVKANVWMLIFGFVGNYFWTHYFYTLLGAAYTLPSFRLNGVRARAACARRNTQTAAAAKGGSRRFCCVACRRNHRYKHHHTTPTTTTTTKRSSNQVPVPMYLMTHAYFLFYHAASNVLLRRLDGALAGRATPAQRHAARAAAVFALAYATAYMETLTIAHVRERA